VKLPDPRVPSHAPDPFVRDLLKRVANLYGSCRTYQDTGETTKTTRWDEPPQVRKYSARFKTAFVRPDRFLFEDRDALDDSAPGRATDAVWIDASGSGGAWSAFERFPKEWLSALPIRKAVMLILGSLDSGALGSFAFVPELLRVGDDRHSPLPDPSNARSLGVAEHDGMLCERIESTHLPRRDVLWVERGTDLVLKLESIETFDDAYDDSVEKMIPLTPTWQHLEDPSPGSPGTRLHGSARRPRVNRDPFRSVRTVVWRPIMDRPVDSASLEFTPPTEGF